MPWSMTLSGLGRGARPGARGGCPHRPPLTSRNRQAVSGLSSLGSSTSRRCSRPAGARPPGWPAAEPRQSWHCLRPVLQHSGQSRRFVPWHFGQESTPPQPHLTRPAPRHSKQLSTPVSLQRRQPCMPLAPGRGRAACPRPAPLAVSLLPRAGCLGTPLSSDSPARDGGATVDCRMAFEAEHSGRGQHDPDGPSAASGVVQR